MINVAILIFDGVYLLDFCGPLEVFNDAIYEDKKVYNVMLIGADLNPINCHTGMIIKPDYTIENCPSPDILVIPGGNLNLVQENTSIDEWINEVSSKAMITLSVCTGAFILAELGLLDGLKATTWFGAIDNLQKRYPNINVVKERFTDNGRIITTAGVSAGIDGALHVVSKTTNKETADKTAKFIEYDWNR